MEQLLEASPDVITSTAERGEERVFGCAVIVIVANPAEPVLGWTESQPEVVDSVICAFHTSFVENDIFSWSGIPGSDASKIIPEEKDFWLSAEIFISERTSEPDSGFVQEKRKKAQVDKKRILLQCLLCSKSCMWILRAMWVYTRSIQ